MQSKPQSSDAPSLIIFIKAYICYVSSNMKNERKIMKLTMNDVPNKNDDALMPSFLWITNARGIHEIFKSIGAESTTHHITKTRKGSLIHELFKIDKKNAS